MRQHWMILIGVVLALVVGVTAVWAVGGMGPGGRMLGKGGLMRHMARQLNLTQAQQDQIKGLLQQERTQNQQTRQALRQARQDLLSATKGGQFDQTQVGAIAARIAQARADLIVSHAWVKSRIYNEVLTPDQRVKVDTLMQKWQARRAQGRPGAGACGTTRAPAPVPGQ